MRLIGSESFFQTQETFTEFNNVQSIKLTGKLSKSTFRKAVEHLLEKFELLQQGVILHNNQKYFHKIDNYKKFFFESNYLEIERKTENTWRECFDNEIENGSKIYVSRAKDLNKEQNEFKFTCGLMWKVLLIHQENDDDFEILISIDHTIADGITICVMTGELMNFIRKIELNEKIESKFIKITPYLRDIFVNEEVIKNTNFSGKMCGFKFDFKEKKYDKLRQEYVFHEYDGENLVKAAKKNGVTVNSAVAAALFLSYSKNFMKEEFGRFMQFSVPMSIRNVANLDSDALGMLASFLYMEFEYKKENVNEEYFWEIAKQMQKNVKYSIEK